MKNNLSRDWVKYGTICGLISAGTYMFLNVLMNIPDVSIPHSIIRIAFFSVGIFGVVSVGGFYHLIKKHKNGAVLQMALLLSIVTFAFFTLMAVIQETTGVFWQESLAGNQSDESINSIWHAVDADATDDCQKNTVNVLKLVQDKNLYQSMNFRGNVKKVKSTTYLVNLINEITTRDLNYLYWLETK